MQSNRSKLSIRKVRFEIWKRG